MRSFLCVSLAVALAACTSTRPPLPGPVVEVFVPVPVPCEIGQVEITPLPSEQGVSEDIYDAVRLILADRAILQADREQLKAANSDPCPVAEITE